MWITYFPQVIVILRNPKDVLVSFYHHYRMCVGFGYYKGSWEDFLKLAYSKKLNLGDWFDNVSGWWSTNKDKENFLFIKLEDVVRDARTQVKRMAEFLGKNYSDDIIDKIAVHGRFAKMAENPRCNMEDMPAYDMSISKFFRKGEPGDWRNYFTEKQNKEFDKKYKKRMASLQGLELDFGPENIQTGGDIVESENTKTEADDNAANEKKWCTLVTFNSIG